MVNTDTRGGKRSARAEYTGESMGRNDVSSSVVSQPEKSQLLDRCKASVIASLNFFNVL